MIEQKSDIFLDGVLNIFTDASINNKGPNSWDGCAGAVYVVTRDGVKYMNTPRLAIIKDCTNNIAELTGIELACDIALENQNNFNRINVFSDSEYSIKTLREWIFSWMRASSYNPDADRTVLRKGDGQIVKNQNIIKNIINKICSIDPRMCQFNIYHVKAHSIGNIVKIRNQFYKANGIVINETDAKDIGYYNDIIDNATRDILYEDPDNPSARYKVVPFSIDMYNFNLYKNIIGGRRFND